MPPTGETDLSRLIREMQPHLNPGAYVFCCVAPDSPSIPATVIGTFREDAGLTLILPRESAEQHGLPYTFVSAWITLTIHSALDAVGLTAAVAHALSQAGISCNVVAGYYHDHLFVPLEAGPRAVEILVGMRDQITV
ncbi:ACT domain-containing protein [Candidatus Oscillochloris fontis]|uniref:ACT domain-containing protein n=1 Tax=Candidatus Oscillochloris fontis TaxID=2496868 RepID=UPI00101C06A4|nr:ACT domain-containing protein [Candidatus Oscillochloris fontis]